jgi:hypothetical protein
LTLKHDEPLSNIAVNFNLGRYMKVKVYSDSVEGVANPTFKQLVWTGSADGTVELKLAGAGAGAGAGDAAQDDANNGLMSSMTLTYHAAFSVTHGTPRVSDMVIAGSLWYEGDAIALSGDVDLHLPCAPGRTMFTGQVKIATKVGRCKLTPG